MDYRAFVKKHKDDSKCLFLIHGTNDYLKQDALKRILKSFNVSNSDIDFDSFRDKINEDDIILSCETLPFMSEKRVVLVYDFLGLKTGKQSSEKLIDYVRDISNRSVLIFLMSDKADKRKKLYKSIVKFGIDGEFGDLSENELLNWVVYEFSKNGKKATNMEAKVLVEVCGHEMMTLQSEIAKISSYSESSDVKNGDILKVASKSLEYNVFKIHDLMMKKDISKGLTLFNEIIEKEKNPFGMMGLIASKFRLLYKARALVDAGYPQDKAIKLIGGHPYGAKIALSQCRKFTSVELRSAINKLAELDYMLKSGKAEASLMLEKVILEIYKI